jgi:catabolite regulation protein CreA
VITKREEDEILTTRILTPKHSGIPNHISYHKPGQLDRLLNIKQQTTRTNNKGKY